MRQRTLLIALAAIAIIAAAGIVIVLQPDEAAVQRQQQGFTVFDAFPIRDNGFADGYVTERVDNDLGKFLASTKHLSTLEIRGNEVWAGGWNWPGTELSPVLPKGPAARIVLICLEGDNANGGGD